MSKSSRKKRHSAGPQFRSRRDGAYHRKTCPFCGKQAWESRRDAKAMIKMMRLHQATEEAEGKVINVYVCLRAPEGAVPMFHIGHTAVDGDQKLDPTGRPWHNES